MNPLPMPFESELVNLDFGESLAANDHARLSESAEQALIQNCLAGVPGAWDELYNQFHGRLLHAIRRIAGAIGDANLVEEIAARVWYAVVRSNFNLLARFDISRGCRFSTYLGGIARKEYASYFRSERRRRTREQNSVRPSSGEVLQEVGRSSVELTEFLSSLTPAERSFCLDWLLTDSAETSPPADRPLTAANQRQLRHRVRRKLDRYLESH